MPAEPPRTDDEIRRAVVDRVREVQIPGGDPISEQLLEDVTDTDEEDFRCGTCGTTSSPADGQRGGQGSPEPQPPRGDRNGPY